MLPSRKSNPKGSFIEYYAALFVRRVGVETRHNGLVDAISDFDWSTTDLTVLDVGLLGDRKIQNHRNRFATVGAEKSVLVEHASTSPNRGNLKTGTVVRKTLS